MIRRIFAALGSLLLCCVPALAGGSPETTVVIVNGDSPLSRLVANEYVALRGIPEGHVVVLHDLPGVTTISVDDFLQRIWRPVVAHIEDHGLEGHIDLVTYSADFPFAVDFRSRLPKGNPGHVVGGLASLTGATYLARHVEAGNEFWNLHINRYYRLAVPSGAAGPPDRDAQALSADALRLIAEKRHDAAAKVYRKLLTMRSTNAGDWYNFACCLALIGKKEDALGALAEAAKRGYRNVSHTSKDPDLVSLRAEAKFKSILETMQKSTVRHHPARALRYRDAWTWGDATEDAPTSPDRYMLSTMLAYTGPRGNSLPEILNYLGRSAASDGTRPDGTVYLCKNGNVRSTTREPWFSSLLAGMEALNRRVAFLEKGQGRQTGILPVGKEDVIGAVVGTASFNWEKSGSTLLPGAIAEHLTSFGAAFSNAGQTKLTAFLRAGAAGASGTVREPLALHQKFPNPLIHLFYAEGCSLAEAFYQSTWGPFQLLIVGDGLARPFAVFRNVEVDVPASPWKGTVDLVVKDENRDHELWVDGRPVAFGEKLTVDTTKWSDGQHDIRLVSVDRDPVGTRSALRIAATVMNGTTERRVTLPKPGVVAGDSTLEFAASGAKSMRLLLNGVVAEEGAFDTVRLRADEHGSGPVVAIVEATYADGPRWRSEPVALDVKPVAATPRKTPRGKMDDGVRMPGLVGTAFTGTGNSDKDRHTVHVPWLGTGKGVLSLRQMVPLKGVKRLALHGLFTAPRDGFYQWTAEGKGALDLSVDGRSLGKAPHLARPARFPIWLAEGEHRLDLEITIDGTPNLLLHLSGDVLYCSPEFSHVVGGRGKSAPEIEGAAKGKPISVPAEGLVLRFPRSTKKVRAVAVVPWDGTPLPTEWVVETLSGKTRWRGVKGATVRVLPGRRKNSSDYAIIEFKAPSTKALRLRPVGEGKMVLTRVETLESLP